MATSQLENAATSTGLRPNSLGVAGIAMTVVSAAAPLTVMAGVAPIALAVGGVGVPAAYLLSGVVLAIFAIGFTAMAAAIPRTGGFFVYIGHSFGGVMGFASAVVAIVAYNCLQIGVYGLFAIQTQAALDDLFGITAPWPLIAAIAVLLVFLLGYIGIDIGAKVLGVLIVLESGILAIMGVAIIVQGGADGLGLASFSPSNALNSGTLATVGICFAAYMGFESTALYRAEARDPERTIPRATFLAVGFMALFYTFVVWSVVQAFGESGFRAAAGQQGSKLFFTTIGEYVGGWGEHAMYVLIVTSVYAAQLAFHNAINRYVHGMAVAGALPRVFARTNKFGSPAFSGAVQSVVALVVVLSFAAAGLDPFKQLLIGVNTPGVVGIIGLQVFASLAAVVFFIRRTDLPRRRLLIASSALAAVLMVGVIVYFTKYIAIFTGAGHRMNVSLMLVIPCVLVIGIIGGLVLQRTRPEVLTLLAHDDETVVDHAS
jgi:amino acid transporter